MSKLIRKSNKFSDTVTIEYLGNTYNVIKIKNQDRWVIRMVNQNRVVGEIQIINGRYVALDVGTEETYLRCIDEIDDPSAWAVKTLRDARPNGWAN